MNISAFVGHSVTTTQSCGYATDVTTDTRMSVAILQQNFIYTRQRQMGTQAQNFGAGFGPASAASGNVTPTKSYLSGDICMAEEELGKDSAGHSHLGEDGWGPGGLRQAGERVAGVCMESAARGEGERGPGPQRLDLHGSLELASLPPQHRVSAADARLISKVAGLYPPRPPRLPRAPPKPGVKLLP